MARDDGVPSHRPPVSPGERSREDHARAAGTEPGAADERPASAGAMREQAARKAKKRAKRS